MKPSNLAGELHRSCFAIFFAWAINIERVNIVEAEEDTSELALMYLS